MNYVLIKVVLFILATTNSVLTPAAKKAGIGFSMKHIDNSGIIGNIFYFFI